MFPGGMEDSPVSKTDARRRIWRLCRPDRTRTEPEDYLDAGKKDGERLGKVRSPSGRNVIFQGPHFFPGTDNFSRDRQFFQGQTICHPH